MSAHEWDCEAAGCPGCLGLDGVCPWHLQAEKEETRLKNVRWWNSLADGSLQEPEAFQRVDDPELTNRSLHMRLRSRQAPDAGIPPQVLARVFGPCGLPPTSPLTRTDFWSGGLPWDCPGCNGECFRGADGKQCEDCLGSGVFTPKV